jgi:hypothetical protein
MEFAVVPSRIRSVDALRGAHFCAPVFAFAAGIGAFFWYQHGRTLAQLWRFLLTRRLRLMFLELVTCRLNGLRSFEEPLAQLSEFGHQVFRFAAGKCGRVNFDGQLLGDSEVGATRKAQLFGAPGELK